MLFIYYLRIIFLYKLIILYIILNFLNPIKFIFILFFHTFYSINLTVTVTSPEARLAKSQMVVFQVFETSSFSIRFENGLYQIPNDLGLH